MGKLFEAVQLNWGLIGPGAWTRREYTVYDDGLCRYASERRPGYCGRSGEELNPSREWRMNEENLARLRLLLQGEFLTAQTHGHACDGTGWEMRAFDGAGNVTHETGPGYIYGVQVLEEIAELL